MVLSALIVLVVGAVFVRFGVLTPAGRAVVVAGFDGIRTGPWGHLKVEGLSGDVFGHFRLRRLAIVDAQGAWLDARDLEAEFRPLELVQRRAHLTTLRVGDLLIARAPVLEHRTPHAPELMILAVKLDAVRGRLRTGAALTVAPGDWAVTGALDMLRDGRAAGRVAAESRIHAGDHVRAVFDLKTLNRLSLEADAEEASGGAMAGGMGLAAAEPFSLKAVLKSTEAGGRVDVQSRSGALTPVRAVGRWGPDGGRVDATALVSASRHTARYVTGIGPEARFTLRMTPSHTSDAYETDAVLDGDLAHAHAHGLVDARTLRTAGMAIEAQVKDLSGWFKPPHLGPARATGIARGGWGDLKIEGRAAADTLSELDIIIARLEGPATVTYAKGEWRVAGDFTGAGVSGLGVLPALVGPAPKAHIDLSRLPDGRVLFRALNVVGRYIGVDAVGDITLLGDLTFKGRFEAPSLVGAAPGAHGRLTAGFDAFSKKDSDFWTLKGEGHGEAFATGLGELDRLIGPQPRLTATGSWTPAGFVITRADLTGASADATAKGTYSTGKVWDVALDWRARGPFAVGPLQVDGAMTGDGHVTGPIEAPRADLHARLASLDLGRLSLAPAALELSFFGKDGALDGRIAVSGPSNSGPASAKAAFRFAGSGVDLREVDADAGGVKLAGALALRNGEPSTADLSVSAGPGAFLSHGSLTGMLKVAAPAGGGAARAVLALRGTDLASPDLPVTLRTLQLSADGPLDRLPYRATAESSDAIPWRLTGSGVVTKAGEARELSFDGQGRIRRAEVKTLETARLRFGPGELAARLRLALAGGRLEFDGRQAQGAVTAKADLRDVGLSAFNEDYVGAVTGALSLNGHGRDLSGRADVALKGARSRDATPDLAIDARLQGELGAGRLRLVADGSNAQGLKADARLDLPAETSAEPLRIAVRGDRPITGQVAIDGEVRPLWDLFAGGARTVTGKLTGKGAISGTLNDPVLTGGAQLSAGSVADRAVGLTLKNLMGSAEFGKGLVTLRDVSGDDGKGGRLSGDGSVSLTRNGGSTLKLALNRFHLFDNDLGRATASGAVTVTRDASGHAKLVGKIGVDRADLSAKAQTTPGVVAMEVREINAPARGVMETAGPSRRAVATAIALDVAIAAARGVFIRGRGLDVELSLDSHVGGTTLAPELSGEARVVRGSYDFSGKKFDFNEFGVVRLNAKPELIRLDLTAERNENGLDARVRVTGTAAHPDVTLTSIPTLPQDEILSRVLFGVSASQLSPFEAAQLASAVTALATGGGFDVLGSVRQFARLDRLALGGGPAGATIVAGKYLTDNLYLEVTGAGNSRGDAQTGYIPTGRTGSSAQIEWRVRRNLSLVGQAWTGGASRLSVRFRKGR